MRKKAVLVLLCALIAAGSLTVSANADSLKQVDRALYRYSDSGENLGKYTGFARSGDGRRHYYKKGALVKEKWIKTDSGKRYYADKTGTLLTGTKLIGDQVYVFDSRGKWNGEAPTVIDENLGISFTLKEQTDSEITAEISLEDSFPFTVEYGREFFLQKKNGKKWEKVALPEDAAFTDEGYEINPGETVTVNIPLSVYGKLSKGKYRIDQSVFVWENDKKQTKASLTFTIQ